MPYRDSLWLCLDFSDLPLEIWQRGLADPDLPLVVVDQGRVCRLNPAATALGIDAGTTLTTALTLNESLMVCERDRQKEQTILTQIARWLYRFTPAVSTRPPDRLVLDISGSLRLFGGQDALTQQVLAGLRTLGYQPRAAVARTPLAAQLAARNRSPGGNVPVRDLVTSFAVDHLDIDPAIIDGLQQMGIRTLRHLLSLPRAPLTRRFGVFFVDYLDRLLGDIPDPQKYIDPKPHFYSEISFVTDVTNKNALIFPIGRLLDELSKFLNGRQLVTDHISWKLGHRAHPPVTFNISLAAPEHDRNIFLPLTQLKLDRLEDLSELDSIALTVKAFSPAKPAAGDLFHGTRFQRRDGHISSLADKSQAEHLLNVLGARLEPQAYFGLSLANDHRPEKTWCKTRPGQSDHSQFTQVSDAHSPRPSFLLSAPKSLPVVDGAPCLGGKLTLLKGPERIDFGWWDRQDLRQPLGRDYYVARQQDGALFWIFEYPDPVERDPVSHDSIINIHADKSDRKKDDDRRWYLHGIFS